MKSERDPLLFVHDILEAIKAIRAYLTGYTLESFLGSREKQDAVMRNFEIIGEALKNVDKSFPGLREKYPQVRWRSIIGMREFIAHEYFGIDREAVWSAYTDDLDLFESQINSILEYLNGVEK